MWPHFVKCRVDDAEATTASALCAALRGEPLSWSEANASEVEARFRDCAIHHGVGPLFSRQLARLLPHDRNGTDAQRVAQELKHEVAIELLRKRELLRMLSALSESGVTALLLKGTALAYSIYPTPALRPRADTDLLIRTADQELTARTLLKLGYEKPNVSSGEFVTYQCGYVRRDPSGMTHLLDVHWRVNNTQMFSRALEYEELRSRSVPVAALGEHALALAPADALLLACMHRVHHMHLPFYADGAPGSGGDRLIWLYDIHLLIDSMSFRELIEFARLVEKKAMRAICRDGLLQARHCFGTRIPEEVLLALARKGPTEPSEAHLRANGIRRLLIELRSLPCLRDRMRLLGEHLFPPPDYMLEKYAVTNRAWLPMLYLQRGIHGAWKRIYSA
jgi:hypothetical protein